MREVLSATNNNRLSDIAMNKSNRDLLVLLNQDLKSPQAIENEVHSLHQILYQVERISHFITAHEVIDLNNYKIHRNPVLMKRMIRGKKETPFVFISNLN